MKKKIILSLLTILLSLHAMAQGYVVTISHSPSPTAICYGDSITFTATIIGCTSYSIQWELNTNNVGTNSTTYTTNALPTGTNTIWCEVTSSTCAGSPVVSNTVAVFVSICSGVNEINNNNSFTISPNPSSSIFTLQSTTQLFSNSTFTITSILGKKIHEQKIVSEKTEINLSNHPKGIYFVKVIQDGKTEDKKIILM